VQSGATQGGVPARSYRRPSWLWVLTCAEVSTEG
jgi:hypothetical protein